MPLFPGESWKRAILQLLALYVAALLLGWMIGMTWMPLALVSMGVVAWHYWRLWRLLTKLTGRRRLAPANGSSVWSETEGLLHRRQNDVRNRKRRLVDMLRAYRAAAAVLPDAVVIIDRNTQRVAWFNEAAVRLLGLSYPRDSDTPLAELLHPLPIALWMTAGQHAEPMLDAPAPHDPNIRLNLRLIPYSDQQWLLVARDISKLMHLEQVRRDFVANVSHELRTPLTVIHGYLELFDPLDMPEWAPMFEEMRKQSQRMAQIVEDLLTLSRLEAQEVIPEETVSMPSLLRTLRREGDALSQGRHKISVEDVAGVDLLGSTKELHSAFQNLVSNAVRYTPSGGSIRIRFARDGGDGAVLSGAVLSVQDTGYGIPAQHLPRITERFYRVSTSRSRESGGTGLGLSIVKHVLALHQARLEIQSEVGQGSTFSIHFGAARVQPRVAHGTEVA
ncbi:MAG TPA: phosphate regulon sensor histidine kinase PhoR [Xanthomonadaceae bacterium]|nr:phosphate regulon sensor histidine kinase PhoR [Xanthomonadaceae bacterium]